MYVKASLIIMLVLTVTATEEKFENLNPGSKDLTVEHS